MFLHLVKTVQVPLKRHSNRNGRQASIEHPVYVWATYETSATIRQNPPGGNFFTTTF